MCRNSDNKVYSLDGFMSEKRANDVVQEREKYTLYIGDIQ